MLWYFCGAGTAYAESRDGLIWERPELGVREHEGSRRNNLLPSSHDGDPNISWSGFSFVFYDRKEQNPERRYKALASYLFTPPPVKSPGADVQVAPASGFYPARLARRSPLDDAQDVIHPKLGRGTHVL